MFNFLAKNIFRYALYKKYKALIWRVIFCLVALLAIEWIYADIYQLSSVSGASVCEAMDLEADRVSCLQKLEGRSYLSLLFKWSLELVLLLIIVFSINSPFRQGNNPNNKKMLDEAAKKVTMPQSITDTPHAPKAVIDEARSKKLSELAAKDKPRTTQDIIYDGVKKK